MNYFRCLSFSTKYKNLKEVRKGKLNCFPFFLFVKGVKMNIHERLIKAVKGGYLQEVKLLVDKGGVDIHANNEEALYRAAITGHLSIMKYLIGQGANDYVTALEYATRENHLNMVKYLVDQVELSTQDVYYALRWAKYLGLQEITACLSESFRKLSCTHVENLINRKETDF